MKQDNWKFIATILLTLVIQIVVALTYLHENFAKSEAVNELKGDVKAIIQQRSESEKQLIDAINKNTQAIIRLEEAIKRFDK